MVPVKQTRVAGPHIKTNLDGTTATESDGDDGARVVSTSTTPSYARRLTKHSVNGSEASGYVRGANCVPVADDPRDKAALVALYEATDGANWKITTPTG